MDFSPFLVKCHFSNLSVREFVILTLTNFYVRNMLFEISHFKTPLMYNIAKDVNLRCLRILTYKYVSVLDKTLNRNKMFIYD